MPGGTGLNRHPCTCTWPLSKQTERMGGSVLRHSYDTWCAISGWEFYTGCHSPSRFRPWLKIPRSSAATITSAKELADSGDVPTLVMQRTTNACTSSSLTSLVVAITKAGELQTTVEYKMTLRLWAIIINNYYNNNIELNTKFRTSSVYLFIQTQCLIRSTLSSGQVHDKVSACTCNNKVNKINWAPYVHVLAFNIIYIYTLLHCFHWFHL